MYKNLEMPLTDSFYLKGEERLPEIYPSFSIPTPFLIRFGINMNGNFCPRKVNYLNSGKILKSGISIKC